LKITSRETEKNRISLVCYSYSLVCCSCPYILTALVVHSPVYLLGYTGAPCGLPDAAQLRPCRPCQSWEFLRLLAGFLKPIDFRCRFRMGSACSGYWFRACFPVNTHPSIPSVRGEGKKIRACARALIRSLVFLLR
jgi:hypothetical protein